MSQNGVTLGRYLGSLGRALFRPPSLTAPSHRIEAIDLARGMAVALMILSHGVNGLLPFSEFPAWGQVPIHLITKFSSSLFILVFGIALVLAQLPHVHTADWPRRRLAMLLTGLVIFFWYKILTIVERIQFYEPAAILDTLLYRDFPSFVEILGFYALALLWVPFFLPLWARTPLLLRLASPVLLLVLAQGLARHFHFWDNLTLRAILVEHEDYYTWGQLARGPLILVGLLLGELVVLCYRHYRYRLWLAGFLALSSALLLGVFFVLVAPDVSAHLEAVARNVGKHPPELLYMLFSVGGAFLVLSLCLLGDARLAALFRPITIIGTDALKAFIFHIVVIFIFFRYLLGYWHDVSYPYALTLGLLLIPATALWIKTTAWVEKQRARPKK